MRRPASGRLESYAFGVTHVRDDAWWAAHQATTLAAFRIDTPPPARIPRVPPNPRPDWLTSPGGGTPHHFIFPEARSLDACNRDRKLLCSDWGSRHSVVSRWCSQVADTKRKYGAIKSPTLAPTPQLRKSTAGHRCLLPLGLPTGPWEDECWPRSFCTTRTPGSSKP
jgi:hypothetical protein